MKPRQGCPATVGEVEIIDMLISLFLMIIISTSPTVRGLPLSWFHVEARLPFRNCEMDYLVSNFSFLLIAFVTHLLATNISVSLNKL